MIDEPKDSPQAPGPAPAATLQLPPMIRNEHDRVESFKRVLEKEHQRFDVEKRRINEAMEQMQARHADETDNMRLLRNRLEAERDTMHELIAKQQDAMELALRDEFRRAVSAAVEGMQDVLRELLVRGTAEIGSHPSECIIRGELARVVPCKLDGATEPPDSGKWRRMRGFYDDGDKPRPPTPSASPNQRRPAAP